MADEAIAAADDTAASEQALSADSQSDDTDQTQDSADTQATADQAAGDTAAKQAQDDGKKAESNNSADKTNQSDGKPRSRRSAAYRINQLNTKVHDLEAKLADKKDGQGDDNAAPDGKQPDIAALVQQEIAKHLKPFESANTKAADDAELTELFAGKPEEKAKYEGKIREMWNLPQYKDLSAEDLFKIASYKDAMAKGAAEARKADEDAKNDSTGGNAARTTAQTKDYMSMSNDEFEKEKQKVKQGGGR